MISVYRGSGRRRPACLAAGLSLLALAACSAEEPQLEYVEQPVEELYNRAVDSALAGDYRAAAPLFDEVERQHPYSIWATQAQLMAAYALYQSNNYSGAIGAIDRFIQLNPGNRNIDYAFYLKGLSYYEQIVDVERDQGLTRNAMETLRELIQRFPDSKYSRDAKLKLDLTRNHLAGKEMAIGRFYLREGKYLAAINRFKRVVENFDTTDQVPEALHRMTEAYISLGLNEQAERSAAVLGYNYPGSEWYQDSYALVTTGANRDQGDGDDGLLGLGLWVF